MRRYGSTKKNPNPPWPCQQSVVVVPPGSSAAAVGKINEPTRSLPAMAQGTTGANALQTGEVVHSRDNQVPIMGYMTNSKMAETDNTGAGCGRTEVSAYLCRVLGHWMKVEFLFGDNTHIEKIGILKDVGKDFIVIEEAGSGSRIVCSMKNIKFINIYSGTR